MCAVLGVPMIDAVNGTALTPRSILESTMSMATSNTAPSPDDIALAVPSNAQRLQPAERQRRPTAARQPGAPHRLTELRSPASEVAIHIAPHRRCVTSVTILPTSGYTNES